MPFRRHLSFANVTASIALFVALGGTGYAAIRLPRNSVGATQIRQNAVRSSEIRAGAVGRSEVRSGAVGSSEIRTDGVGASEIRRGGVGTSEIHNGSVRNADIAAGAVKSANLAAGAVAPANLSAASLALFQSALLRSGVDADGTAVAGNAQSANHTDTGQYTVTFSRDVSACFYSATPAKVKTGAPDDGATVSVASAGTTAPDNANVLVRTFDRTASAADEPFQLIVVC